MVYLSLVTLVWAFSFSLIGEFLAGKVDPFFAAFSRSSMALLLFLPFLKNTQVIRKSSIKCILIGGVQLGLMYVFYYQSFLYLSVPEILVFTIFTPVYITFFYDLYHRIFSVRFLISALLATIGAAIIRYTDISESYLIGFFLIQGANICFALGQVSYKIMVKNIKQEFSQKNLFGYFYLGSTLVTGAAFLLYGDTYKLPTTTTQWGILLWLGFVASGCGFFMWNKGATKVSAGTLAVMNNVLIPVGLLENMIFWNREQDILRLSIGGGIIFLALIFDNFFLKKTSI